MDSLVLVVATLGLGFSIASLINSIAINKKIVHKREIIDIQKKLIELEQRINELYGLKERI
jgi:hypothetical protein